MEEFVRKLREISAATSLDELNKLKDDVTNMKIENSDSLLSVIGDKRENLQKDAMIKGTIFEDASQLYSLRNHSFPKSAHFGLICREETPSFYQHITTAAATRLSRHQSRRGSDSSGEAKLQQICTKTLGSNSEYPKGDKDMFGKSADPVRAHIFLDSPTCGPAWGHMAEGATGKIEGTDNEEKNHIRVLRMMGGHIKQTDCLRKDLRNFVRLHNEHMVYYDHNPQLMIVPLLPLEQIKRWETTVSYEVAILVSKPHCSRVEEGHPYHEIYQTILSNFWDDYDETTNVCTDGDIEVAFTNLRHFIRALAYSLDEKFPQNLLRLVARTGVSKNTQTKKKSSNGRGIRKIPVSPSSSRAGSPSSGQEDEDSEPNNREFDSKEEQLDAAGSEIKKGDDKNPKIPLPFFEKDKPHRPVLKLTFEGDFIPDPWLLMAKAAVNFSWTAYGHKLLPACKPPPDEATAEFEQAVLEHEQRQRERDVVPAFLTIPATPPTKVTPISTIVTPPTYEEGLAQDWEALSDSSF